MKKFLSILLVALVLTAAFPWFAFAADGGFRVADAVIVVSADAADTENYAAQRLKYYLDKITGGDIGIITDDESSGKAEISVGNTNRTDSGLSEEKDGSYIIVSDENKLVINGAGNKGTINGVYAFLEKYCGCRWFEDEVIIVPENSTLAVASDIDVEYTPYFEFTDTDTKSSRDAEFSLANGLTSGVYRTLTAEQGGTVSYIGSSSHTLVNNYCKPSVYFAEHPEYFALVGGQRMGTQLCLTNPDVLDVVTQEVLAAIEKNHNPDASVQIVSVTQADNGEYCQCENCAALDAQNGSQSGTMITFVNEIARRVAATGLYDNIAFDTFAYQYTRKAPTSVVPRDDVIVRLCSIECCFGHTLDDDSCKTNAAFMEDLRAWNKIHDRMYIWDYVLNCYESVVIHPNFGVLQRNIQLFYEHGVKGIYEQGVFYISESDGEFGEMKTYLLSKLMQDPYLDYDKCMEEYMVGVYGPGGVYLKEFIDIVTKNAVTPFTHLRIDQESYLVMMTMNDIDVWRCNKLWEKAKEMAETEEQLAQIKRSEICWRYWKCAHYRSEFSLLQNPYVRMNACQLLYEDMVAMGITRIGERANHDLSHNACLRYFRHITTWITLYDEPVWEDLEPVAIGIYKAFEMIYKVTHFYKYI